MELNKLYASYGQLLIQAEILQNRITEVKRQIAEELNKTAKIPENGKEENA